LRSKDSEPDLLQREKNKRREKRGRGAERET